MHSPTLANDFSFRLTLAFAPFSQFFLAAFDASPANPLFSHSCGLFFSLGALFDAPLVCFQQLADSFCKIPGVGVALQHLSALCACPFCSCVSALSLPFFCRPFIFIRLQIPSRRASIRNILCFHALTNPFFRNFFVFTSIQNARVSLHVTTFPPTVWTLFSGNFPFPQSRVIVLASKGDLLNVSE